jgi:hypothetical protein
MMMANSSAYSPSVVLRACSHSISLTKFKQYNHERERHIVIDMNGSQEDVGNKKGISTVWLCDAIGNYYPLDTEDERYASIAHQDETQGRMVYHLAVTAVALCHPRDYSDDSLDKDEHFKEFQNALSIMASHNRKINQR